MPDLDVIRICLKSLKTENIAKILQLLGLNILTVLLGTILQLFQMMSCFDMADKVTKVLVMAQVRRLKWMLQVLVKMLLGIFMSWLVFRGFNLKNMSQTRWSSTKESTNKTKSSSRSKTCSSQLNTLHANTNKIPFLPMSSLSTTCK